MAWYNWSRTAASNATADTSINMAEGMAPSQVNDGIRALMARTAEYRDDISGAIATGGTSTAYTVTSYSVFDTLAHMSGQMIAFTPHTTNAATVTLNVDGLGAKPLRTSPNVELLAGMLVQGTPYVATYNNSDAAWYLHNFFGNPYNIPLGGVLSYSGPTAPNSSFVLPFGQAISRTTYASYFSLVGSTYGAGDSSTTFNVPDLRGRGVFYKDDMGGSAASRITAGTSGIDAATLGSSGGTETHTLTVAQIPAHDHGGNTGAMSANATHSHGVSGGRWGSNSSSGATAPSPGGGAFVAGGNTLITIDAANTDHTHAIGSQGGGGGHQNMPPAYILNCIMRVI